MPATRSWGGGDPASPEGGSIAMIGLSTPNKRRKQRHAGLRTVVNAHAAILGGWSSEPSVRRRPLDLPGLLDFRSISRRRH